MHVLVMNSGSSSIKFSVFETGADGAEPALRLDGEVSGFGTSKARLAVNGGSAEEFAGDGTSEAAVGALLQAIPQEQRSALGAVGYRVVHPGAKLHDHVEITDAVIEELRMAAAFAPLHDPPAIAIISELRRQMPTARHFACFDTVFHQTMPEEATVYPIPQVYRDQGVRRYGFHGLSCESIVRRMRLATGSFPRRAAIAHLGSGCSVTALIDGRSVDNTMGLTPTGGVVMGTRPGDLDPGLVLYLLRQQPGDGAAALETMLNHSAGMVALSGMANDVKAVRQAAEQGNKAARLALDVFVRSVRRSLGGFAWQLGGLDAVIFSGGIGEHDAATRAEVMAGLGELGLELDLMLNAERGQGVRRVSKESSRTCVWVAPAEEDLMIALHVEEMLRQKEHSPTQQ